MPVNSCALFFLLGSLCMLNAVSSASKADDIRAFDEWYQSINKNDKVRLEMIDDEPGFIATGNLIHTEMALITPYEVLLSSETVENDAVLGDIIEDIYDEDEPDQLKPVQFDAICVYYLYHKFCDKDPKFMWKLYFKALPDQYDSTLFFSNDDLEQLKGSALYEAAIEERKFVDEKFKFLNEKLFEKNPEVFGECKPTLQQFKWSYATVTARKLDLLHSNKNTKKERKFVAVAPYFDFMRHYPFSKVEWGYSSSTSTLHCEAHENVRKGQEIFRSYGELSNAELLKEQGYILEQNAFNAVMFEPSLFEVDKSDPAHEKKQLAVNELLTKSKHLRILDGGLSQELIDIAKIVSGKSMEKSSNDGVDTMYRAFLYLEKLCDRKLSKYPTKLEEDEAFMQSEAFEELTSRAKNARMVVLEEKRILNTMKGEFNNMARRKLNEAKKRGIEIDLKDEL